MFNTAIEMYYSQKCNGTQNIDSFSLTNQTDLNVSHNRDELKREIKSIVTEILDALSETNVYTSEYGLYVGNEIYEIFNKLENGSITLEKSIEIFKEWHNRIIPATIGFKSKTVKYSDSKVSNL